MAKDKIVEDDNAAKQKFRDKVAASKDLSDELQDLVDHLKEFTDSTAVYDGKVVLPIKAITEGSDDTAHILEGAQPQIQYLNSTKDCNELIGPHCTSINDDDFALSNAETIESQTR